MNLMGRLRHRSIHAKTRDDRAYWTRAYLRHKAKRGIWDKRMLNGHPNNVNDAVRAFVMRAVAGGLVCTSTTDGVHSVKSFHYPRFGMPGAAADVGHRKPGTKAAREAEIKFQQREAWRADRYLELYGPDNGACVRHGKKITIAEGTALEQNHDNHVHGVPRW